MNALQPASNGVGVSPRSTARDSNRARLAVIEARLVITLACSARTSPWRTACHLAPAGSMPAAPRIPLLAKPEILLTRSQAGRGQQRDREQPTERHRACAMRMISVPSGSPDPVCERVDGVVQFAAQQDDRLRCRRSQVIFIWCTGRMPSIDQEHRAACPATGSRPSPSNGSRFCLPRSRLAVRLEHRQLR